IFADGPSIICSPLNRRPSAPQPHVNHCRSAYTRRITMNMHTAADLNPASIAAAAAVIGHNSQAEWSSGHIPLAPYEPTDEIEAVVDELVALHRERQFVLKNKTTLILAQTAAARSM